MSLLGVGRDKTCFLCQMPRKCGGAEAALRWLFWEAGDKRGAGGREPDHFSWDLACPLRGGQGTQGAQEPWGAPGGVGVPSPLRALSDSPGQEMEEKGSFSHWTSARRVFSAGMPSSLVPKARAPLPGGFLLRAPPESAPLLSAPALGTFVPQDREGWGSGAQWTVFTNQAMTMRTGAMWCVFVHPPPFIFG